MLPTTKPRMIITISGTPGAGKDTIGKLVAKKLGLKFYCMGDMRRKMAADRGMTIEQLNKLGEKEDWTDKEADNYQAKLGQTEDNFVAVGRTSFHFIPKSKKIFLDVTLEEGARRIINDKSSARDVEKYKDIKEAMQKLKERKESDNKRYMKYYNLNIFDKKHYDLVIDTTNKKPEEVVDLIVNFAKKK